MSLDKLLAKEL